VISTQIFFIDFLEELALFIEEKPIFTKKKSIALPSVNQCCQGHTFFFFQRMLRGVFFSHLDEFLRVVPKQTFGFFKVFKSFKIAKLFEIE
jgi:hypothetical protein